jgi:hypothetical protein
VVPDVRPLRQLVVSPGAFFDERPPVETLPIAAGVVVAFAVCLAVGLLLVGSMLAGAVDATVTMDNPDRPPDWVCADHADDPDSPLGQGCDEPATIQRDAGAILREAVDGYLWLAFVLPFVLWPVAGIVLFGAGRLAGGSPSFRGTLALAGWAALPEFFRLGVGLAGLWFVLSGVTITDPVRGVAAFEAAMAPVEPVLLAASLVTIGWQWYLLTGGLEREAGLPRGAAALAVGVPLVLFSLVGLA